MVTLEGSMTRSRRDENARQAARDEDRALSHGRRFRVLWLWDARQHGPVYFATADEAVAKVDEMFTTENKPIPSDFHDRQAVLLKFDVWAEEHVDGGWRPIHRRDDGIFGVKYLD